MRQYLADFHLHIFEQKFTFCSEYLADIYVTAISADFHFIFYAFQAWHQQQKEQLKTHCTFDFFSLCHPNHVPLLSHFTWHLPLCIFNQVVFTLHKVRRTHQPSPCIVEQYVTSWYIVSYKSWHTSPHLNNTKLNGSEIITRRGKLPINFGWIIVIPGMMTIVIINNKTIILIHSWNMILIGWSTWEVSL